jgi:outer membrane protein assembly factor BamB/tetratricopeptide (TPR) repeat protein
MPGGRKSSSASPTARHKCRGSGRAPVSPTDLWDAVLGFLFCCALVVAPAGVTAARAQEQAAEDRAAVYIGDSFEASSALKRADQLAGAKRWAEAAQAYRQAVQRFPDKVVASGAGFYIGTAEYANQQIAKWPGEGLSAYLLLYGEPARQELAGAQAERNLAALLSVAEDYFCTPAGATAADLAAQLAMESGDFDLPERLYTQLLAQHPDRRRLAGDWIGRLAINRVWAGRSDRARALLDKAKKEFPQARLSWAGSRRDLARVVNEVITEQAMAAPAEKAFGWPLLGGSPQRNRVAVGDIPIGAPLWECGPKQGFAPGQSEHRIEGDRAVQTDILMMRAGRRLSMVPVMDGGLLYLCDASSVWGVRMADGSLAWPPYASSKDSARHPLTPSLGEPPPLNSCTFHDGRLFAILGRERGPAEQEQPGNPTVLVCLDTGTGKPLWSIELAELDRRLAELRFDGSPVYQQGRLFVVGRRQKRFGFEDCYLLRFDAETGRLDWMTYLASASTGSFGYRRATLDLPAVNEGTVYICTNLGAIAAVNTYNGRIRWLRVYQEPRIEDEPSPGYTYATRAMPWRYTPSICWRDRLIVSPLDSDRVLVLDRASGRIVNQIAVEDLGHLTQILGVADDLLYAAGADLVAWDLVGNQARWSRSLSDYGRPLGRGQLTTTHIYLPMAKGLYRFALKGGDPEAFEWPDESRGGNVAVAPGQVVIVGADRLTAYVSRQEAFARLQKRIEQAPKDPLPLLDLAEVACRVGEHGPGIEALNRAVEVCGGFAGITDAGIKTRIFNDFVRFGDKAIAGDDHDERLALELYQQAAQCPPDADGQVLYRLRLAELFLRMRNLEKAIDQYQQIIGDRSLRQRSAVPQGSRETWPAGQWAEKQIAKIMSQYGPGSYEPYERQAESLLTAGRETGELEPLQQVINRFPNSKAAGQALLAKAQLLDRRGEYQEAVRAFLQILNRDPQRAEAPEIMRQIAEICVRSNRPAAARRWLARAAKAFPQYRFEHNGRSIGFAEYKVDAAGPSAAEVRPRFSLPLTRSWARRFPGPVWVLQPQDTSLPGTRWDMYVTWCGNRLEAFSAPGNLPMWSAPVPCEVKPALLGMAQGRLILSTRRQLLGVEIATGKVTWSAECASADADRPELDPENVRKWTALTMTEDRVVGIIDDGRALCLDARSGREVWQGQLAHKVGNHLLASDEFIVYEGSVQQSSLFTLYVLDAETGRELHTLRTDDPGRAFWMAFSEQGLLLASTGNRLFAFDPYSGALIWQSPVLLSNLRSSIQLGAEALFLSRPSVPPDRQS